MEKKIGKILVDKIQLNREIEIISNAYKKSRQMTKNILKKMKKKTEPVRIGLCSRNELFCPKLKR